MGVARLRILRRFLFVAWHTFPLGWSYLRDRRRYVVVGSSRTPTPSMQEARAERLLATFLTLGPTFIKLGQLLSTRPDILPPKYIERLSQLQDEVPPAPWSETEALIESEIGPIEERFDTFDQEAISGASLGQVYTATIDGERVAVKVRRPGVAELVEADLAIIRWWLKLLLPVVDEARAFSLRNLASEFGRVIRQEMNYHREADMMESIAQQFQADPQIVIPRTYAGHSTERVLVMSYEPGIKITDIDSLDAHNINRQNVAERLTRAYLEMIVEHGVFHADPHPGNLAITPDGRIIFYDFGMSGQVEPTDRDRIIDFYVAVGERDLEGIINALVELGTLSPDVDRRVMGEVLELAIRDARGERIEDWRVQQMIERVESTMYEFPLRLPARLALIMRVATVVEGVCVTLDPEFDFIEVATEFLREGGYYEETVRNTVRETGRSVRDAGRSAIRAAPVAERVIDRFDRNDAYIRVGVEDSGDTVALLAQRLIYGMLLSATIVGAAIMYGLAGLDTALAIPGGIAVLLLGLLYRSFRRRRGIRARPSFTRHQMRERQR